MTHRRLPRTICFATIGWLFLIVAAPAALPAKTEAAEMMAWSGGTMGTSYSIIVYAADGSKLDRDEMRLAVDAELRRVNDEMSTYLKSSEIAKFNDSDSTDWMEVSRPMAQVVAFAQDLARTTGGGFDITVAPLVDAWNFGPPPRSGDIPDDDQLAQIASQIGYQKLSVRLDPPAIKKSIPDLRIDLSAIAKGHGVDRVVSVLETIGAENVFVEIGGEVRTAGSKDGQWWKAGIQVPDAKTNEYDIAYALSTSGTSDAAMATSGDYRNYVEVDGKRYSHTIDPRTLRPIDHNLASVSVVAESCMMADAWATALNVLGAADGQRLAREQGINALLISRSDGGFDRTGTGTFAKFSSVPASNAGASAPNSKAAGSSPWVVIAITFVAFATLLFAMAVGVIFSGKSISGSCGGIAGTKAEDGSVSCSLCSNPADACKDLRERMRQNA